MKPQRLHWLLAALVALAILRWMVPPRSEAASPVGVSDAVMRPAHVARVASAPWAASVATAPMSDARQDDDADPAGNAFAVRISQTPALPPAPPTLVKVAVQSAVTRLESLPVAEAVLPPPPRPPLQVIGTWNDATGLAVFVSSPTGTLIARPGLVLMGEYDVTALTPELLSLRQMSTKTEIQLPLPRAQGS